LNSLADGFRAWRRRKVGHTARVQNMIPLRMLELQYAAVLRDEVYSGYVHPKSEILTACKARAGDEIKATQQIGISAKSRLRREEVEEVLNVNEVGRLFPNFNSRSFVWSFSSSR
jgi:hypothetical protein